MSQALIHATEEWVEHVMPDPWHFKRGKISRVHINGVTPSGLEDVSVREAIDRNRVILLLNIFGIHAKLNMSINQVA